MLVFTAPPESSVWHSPREPDAVNQATFLAHRDDGPPVLLLAGRAWRVTSLDWKRRRAYVEPAEDEGRSRWRGRGQFLGAELCGAIRRLLAAETASPTWSRRAGGQLDAIRSDFAWRPGDESNVLYAAGGEASWWTFAGGRANAALAAELSRRLDLKLSSDNFAVKVPPGQRIELIEREIRRLAAGDPESLRASVNEAARDGLKFAECLPVELANRVIEERLDDPAAIAAVLARSTRIVIAQLP